MTIPTEVWVLPRPRKPYYPGSFPLHFEIKLIRALGNPRDILQPFGGMSPYGIRLDLNPALRPGTIGDAHYLPFRNNSFDLVLCDPPYSDELSKSMYNAPPIHYRQYMNEAVRVTRQGGFIASYHWRWTTRPLYTIYDRIIIVLPGQNHRARICCVFRKEQ